MGIGAIRSILTARGRTITRRYVLVAAGANLLWEITQLPLYTIWQTGSPGEIAFAVVHCTVGDVLIAASSFVLALLVAGNASWPHNALGRIIVATVIFGTAYTVFSEWVNVS